MKCSQWQIQVSGKKVHSFCSFLDFQAPPGPSGPLRQAPGRAHGAAFPPAVERARRRRRRRRRRSARFRVEPPRDSARCQFSSVLGAQAVVHEQGHHVAVARGAGGGGAVVDRSFRFAYAGGGG